jgi:hypothetical protein
MFRITEDPSSGKLVQCLAKNYKKDSVVSVDMDVVGVMAANSDPVCMCIVHCIARSPSTVNVMVKTNIPNYFWPPVYRSDNSEFWFRTLTGHNPMRRVHSQPYSCRQDIPSFTKTTSAVLV